MTQSRSNEQIKQGQMQLNLAGCKPIEQDFDGGEVCTDGGLLMLRKADNRLRLSEFAALCIEDNRRSDLVTHTVENLFRQRIYAIAAGYEDCNDAAMLRSDGMHRLALGFEPNSEHLLASQPTLSRFEAMADATSNAALQKLFVFQYIRRQKRKPKIIRLAMDTSCHVAYGYQQLTFFNGFYESACYVPLFLFTDDGFPLAAVLRAGNAGPAEGALQVLRSVVNELRRSWPGVKIEFLADAAFALPEIFEYCEANEVTYFIASKGHNGLAYHSEALLKQCKERFDEFGTAGPELKKYGQLVNPKEAKLAWRQREERIRFSTKEEGRMQEHFEDELVIRDCGEFKYASREWSKERRFIFRVEYSKQGANVRYVVTNSTIKSPRVIYYEKYCQRARCENCIKDLKVYLKSERTSCQEFDANQFRLILHTLAYILLWEIRQTTPVKDMTVETVRLQIIKIGVLIKETTGKVQLHLATKFPWQDQYRIAWSMI